MLAGYQGRQTHLQVGWNMGTVSPAELTVIWSSLLLGDHERIPTHPRSLHKPECVEKETGRAAN